MSGVSARPRFDRELGQNFLVDRNLLGVIERLAELDAHDVVLEVGGGMGVLSAHLAPRVAHLHVVELDARLEPALTQALGEPLAAERASLHLADATRLDLAGLRPLPTKAVGNLPYGVAATVILRVAHDLPSVGLQVAMVQREVGERLAAPPRSPAYGVPSVLAQLGHDVEVARSVSRTVFQPVPNVDSVLVRLRRRADGTPSADAFERSVVKGAFAHRRKALARSLALAGVASRDAARGAVTALGLPDAVRAEALDPPTLRALARRLREGASS